MGGMILIFLWWFQERTKYGAIVRAGVDDDEMTQGIGINISLVKTLIFSIGALLAGFAGVVGGPFVGLSTGLDIEILLLAIVVVIIGGMGKLGGASIGALLIGLVDSFGKSLLPELSIFTMFEKRSLQGYSREKVSGRYLTYLLLTFPPKLSKIQRLLRDSPSGPGSKRNQVLLDQHPQRLLSESWF
jgi:branched-subunit amino acid ABC-type transport system permease component